jgi:hypothetical protein
MLLDAPDFNFSGYHSRLSKLNSASLAGVGQEDGGGLEWRAGRHFG